MQSGTERALHIPFGWRSVYKQNKCVRVELDPAYRYRAACGLDGSYDLANVAKPFLIEKVQQRKNNTFQVENQTAVNFGKPALLAMSLLSYLHYSLGETNPTKYINKDYFEMTCAFRVGA